MRRLAWAIASIMVAPGIVMLIEEGVTVASTGVTVCELVKSTSVNDSEPVLTKSNVIVPSSVTEPVPAAAITGASFSPVIVIVTCSVSLANPSFTVTL